MLLSKPSHRSKSFSRHEGFTIVEVILVVAMVALLSVILFRGFRHRVSSFGFQQDQSRLIYKMNQYREEVGGTGYINGDAGDCGYSDGVAVTECVSIGVYFSFDFDPPGSGEVKSATVHPLYGRNVGSTSTELDDYDPYVPSATPGGRPEVKEVISFSDMTLFTDGAVSGTSFHYKHTAFNEHSAAFSGGGEDLTMVGFGMTNIATSSSLLERDAAADEPIYTDGDGDLASERGNIFTVLKNTSDSDTSYDINKSVDDNLYLVEGGDFSSWVCTVSSSGSRAKMRFGLGHYNNHYDFVGPKVADLGEGGGYTWGWDGGCEGLI